MNDATTNGGWSEHRVGRRYPARLAGTVTVSGKSGRLWRRRDDPIDVVITDLSVFGAAIIGPSASNLARLGKGDAVDLLVHGQAGLVRVHHSQLRGQWMTVGVEFVELSPELEEVVHRAVGGVRTSEGVRVSHWTAAR